MRLLGELRSPLWLDLYVSRDVNGFARAVRDAEKLLGAYERAGKGRVKVAVHQVGKDVAADVPREAGLVEIGEYPPEALGFLGITLRYEAQRSVIPSLPLNSSTGFEFWITNKVRELRDLAEQKQHRIGVVTGKGELRLSDPVLTPRGAATPNIQDVLHQAFPFYALVPVDLQAGKAVIDPSLEGLIITQPAQDYDLAELQRIDQFLLLGNKSLAVFASAVNVAPESAEHEASLDTHGLETLLRGYGVELDADVLWDHASAFEADVWKEDGGRARFRYPLIPLVNSDPRAPTEGPLDASAVPFFRMERVAFPYASSLRLIAGQQPADVKLRGVARTSDDTVSTRATPVSLRPAASYPRGDMRSHLVAAIVHGRLRSAFPVKLASGELVPVALAPSRLLVISSSAYLANPFVYADSATTPDPMLRRLAQPYLSNLTATILTVKNTLDWMLGSEDFAELSATIVPPAP